ncbi:MAG: hypothetical protein ABJB05_17040 [Parafilimonas sp.]
MSARLLKSFLLSAFVLFLSSQLKAKDKPHVKTNDSLTLAQAYVNLTLTEKYFDTLSIGRLNKILPFEESELGSITDTGFIALNGTLYNFTYSLLYLNKAQLLFKTTTKPNREALLQWKQALDMAISHFNNANISSYYTVEKTKNSFYSLIAFNAEACNLLNRNIEMLKGLFTRYFNKDIYPDFKRIFYEAKKANKYYFDSLSYYTSMYGMPLSMHIKNNAPQYEEPENYGPHNLSVKPGYNLSIALNLISQYLQLNYVVKEKAIGDTNHINLYNLYDSYRSFIRLLSPEDSLHFDYDDGILPKGNFFREELNKSACDSLYTLLQKKFPYEYFPVEPDMLAGASGPYNPEPTKYYFPMPAPFPSAYLSTNNYKPGLRTMIQVDDYFKNIFNRKGYGGHLHYYYVQSGFAVITSLEKINKDGSPVSGSKRWSVSVGGNGSFSLYETFKSIFFATESDFRIIGLVISPSAVAVQRNAASIGAMQDLLTYSYPSLPADLQNFSLPQKTLTVLIYDFHQSDIGKVPELDVSKRLSARNHLEKSGLGELLNSR